MMEFYNDVVHKATKNHKCDLCCHLIPKGQKYHRQSGKYDGDFFDRCLHTHCNNIISTYCRENDEQEYDEWSIKDWLSDSYCYYCEQKEDCEINIL
ncbi:MAG: hypothetical protein WAP07_09270, partial [Acutalibacteraceae bacterium]